VNTRQTLLGVKALLKKILIDLRCMLRRFLSFLCAASVGSVICAFLYLSISLRTLPPHDLAYGKSVFEILDNPFVQTVALFLIPSISILIALFAVGCLDERMTTRQALILFGVGVFSVCGLTPFSSFAGMFLPPLLVISTLLVMSTTGDRRLDKK
jgi:hypothetical protein